MSFEVESSQWREHVGMLKFLEGIISIESIRWYQFDECDD